VNELTAGRRWERVQCKNCGQMIWFDPDAEGLLFQHGCSITLWTCRTNVLLERILEKLGGDVPDQVIQFEPRENTLAGAMPEGAHSSERERSDSATREAGR
jgi:hypothetical protein